MPAISGSFLSAERIAKDIEQHPTTTQDIWVFLLRFFIANRVGPSTTEICTAINIISSKSTSSRATVKQQLHKLEGLGLVELPVAKNSARMAGRIIIRHSRFVYDGPYMEEFPFK